MPTTSCCPSPSLDPGIWPLVKINLRELGEVVTSLLGPPREKQEIILRAVRSTCRGYFTSGTRYTALLKELKQSGAKLMRLL